MIRFNESIKGSRVETNHCSWCFRATSQVSLASSSLRISMLLKFCDCRYSCLSMKTASGTSAAFITSSAIEKMLSYKGKVSALLTILSLFLFKLSFRSARPLLQKPWKWSTRTILAKLTLMKWFAAFPFHFCPSLIFTRCHLQVAYFLQSAEVASDDKFEEKMKVFWFLNLLLISLFFPIQIWQGLHHLLFRKLLLFLNIR